MGRQPAGQRTTIRARRLLVLALLMAGLASPARSERVSLNPAAPAPGTTVGLRLYGMGFMPLDGNFTRFDGWLTYDPVTRGICQVELRIEAGSLAMSSESIRNEVTGPDFMDVAQFPALVYAGTCRNGGIEGMLTMHGVTRPFTLAIEAEKNRIVAEGRLRRAEWGMTAKPLVGGSTVRIQVTVPRTPGMPF